MYSDHPIFAKLTTSAVADELGTFDDSQLLQVKMTLEAEFFQPDVLRFAQFLMEDYSFDRLRLLDENKRRRFASRWLNVGCSQEPPPRPTRPRYAFRSCFASPLSTIINSDYELLINEVEIVEGLTNKRADDLVVPKTSKHPIDYDKRFETWPFLRELTDLPASGLKTLVLVANASSIQTNLLEYSQIVGDKSVPEGTICLNKKGALSSGRAKRRIVGTISIPESERLRSPKWDTGYPIKQGGFDQTGQLINASRQRSLAM